MGSCKWYVISIISCLIFELHPIYNIQLGQPCVINFMLYKINIRLF